MADESSAQDRTESPTPRRREEARNEGRVARSQELGAAAVLLGGHGAAGERGRAGLVGFATRLLRESARSLSSGPLTAPGAIQILRDTTQGLIMAMLPFALGLDGRRGRREPRAGARRGLAEAHHADVHAPESAHGHQAHREPGLAVHAAEVPRQDRAAGLHHLAGRAVELARDRLAGGGGPGRDRRGRQDAAGQARRHRGARVPGHRRRRLRVPVPPLREEPAHDPAGRDPRAPRVRGRPHRQGAHAWRSRGPAHAGGCCRACRPPTSSSSTRPTSPSR